MASEYYKCKGELSITDIEEDESKHNACGTYFVDIQDILNSEKDEDPTEFKPISEYGVPNECLKNNENGKFDDTNSSEFEVMLRDVEPTESKFPPAHFSEKENLNGLAGELSKSKIHHFINGVILKSEDEDHPEYIDLLTNNAESKMETIKIEEDIDVIYDIKPEICEEKSCGKTENELYPNVTDIFIGTEIGPNFSHEPSNDMETWPQPNREEDKTVVERDNDTRNHYERTHTGKKTFKCQICDKSFNRKSNLKVHEIIHTEKKLFQCIICLKLFKQKVHLTIHEIIHTGEKLFQCKICDKSFNRKSNLTVHERIHTEVKLFQCKICPKSFEQKKKLTRHEIIHTGKKPFQCKICDKSFNRKSNLTAHERIHAEEKLFQCKICLKSFTRKKTLLYHERIHTGEKPFQCTICLKLFKQKVHLTIHERIHTGEKLFQCKICYKYFNRKSNLTVHERIHTGEKPFQCKICLKSFTGKNPLLYHERIHKEEK